MTGGGGAARSSSIRSPRGTTRGPRSGRRRPEPRCCPRRRPRARARSAPRARCDRRPGCPARRGRRRRPALRERAGPGVRCIPPARDGSRRPTRSRGTAVRGVGSVGGLPRGAARPASGPSFGTPAPEVLDSSRDGTRATESRAETPARGARCTRRRADRELGRRGAPGGDRGRMGPGDPPQMRRSGLWRRESRPLGGDAQANLGSCPRRCTLSCRLAPHGHPSTRAQAGTRVPGSSGRWRSRGGRASGRRARSIRPQGPRASHRRSPWARCGTSP